jgi:uncharacterized protein YqjF (DUF2071 family)
VRCFLSQRWDDLLFAHWPVEPDDVAPLLPAGVEPDLRDGRAWIGVVAFQMLQTRGGALMPMRGLGAIPELNVRTYVRVGGKPGVWFITLDTSSPLFVTIGRCLYGLAYRRARMIVTQAGARVHYVSLCRQAAFVASYEPIGRAASLTPGSLEHWLLERYRLFALRGGRLITAEVAHAPWALQETDARIELNTLDPPGIRFADEPLIHFSPGVDARIGPPEVVVFRDSLEGGECRRLPAGGQRSPRASADSEAPAHFVRVRVAHEAIRLAAHEAHAPRGGADEADTGRRVQAGAQEPKGVIGSTVTNDDGVEPCFDASN